MWRLAQNRAYQAVFAVYLSFHFAWHSSIGAAPKIVVFGNFAELRRLVGPLADSGGASIGEVWTRHLAPEGGGGGLHKASVSDCLPLAVPMGLSPLLILTLCGPERVLVVSTEPPDDGGGGGSLGAGGYGLIRTTGQAAVGTAVLSATQASGRPAMTAWLMPRARAKGSEFLPPPPWKGHPERAAVPLCDIPSGRGFFTGPWTVTRSSLRMLRRVAAFCWPLRPVLLLVLFPRSRSPVVGVLGLC